MAQKYKVNEVFYSLQGEGVRVGTPNVFVRFTGCNLKCNGDIIDQALQPRCDTEFESGTWWTMDELVKLIRQTAPRCQAIVFTGGEPTLQVDEELVTRLKQEHYYLAIETNGTRQVPAGLDWVCVSPKVAEHALQQKEADEVKYVRGYGQGIPQTVVQASHYLISPHCESYGFDPKTIEWCIQLCKEHPPWRLSMQLHKIWHIR